MTEQIYNMLKDLDPMERDRIIDSVKNKLEADRIQKLTKAQAEVFRYEYKK